MSVIFFLPRRTAAAPGVMPPVPAEPAAAMARDLAILMVGQAVQQAPALVRMALVEPTDKVPGEAMVATVAQVIPPITAVRAAQVTPVAMAPPALPAMVLAA